MDAWQAWLAASLVLALLEVLSGGTFVLIMLAGGALAASATSALTDNDFLPWLVFSIVSIGLLVAVRPVAARTARQPMALRSGIDKLVGHEAEVVAEVSGRDGRVKLNGEIWSARAFDGHTTFASGETVHVLQIDGATALVG